jgi:LacI family transcriptional regulator
VSSIREVAQEAGVSVATASRVLSGSGYPVKAQTRDRVLAAAERLGYRRNALAQSFRTGSTSSVGVCATVLSNLTAMSAVEGISECLGGMGRQAQVAMSRWDPARERAALELFLEERVAGVLSFPTLLEKDAYLHLQEDGVPVVLFNRAVPGVPAPVVRHDFASGYRLAVESLAAVGHRRIAALLASHDGDAQARVLKGHGIAWSSALERVGLDPHRDWQLPAGDSLDVPRVRAELERLLAQRERPTALFCGVVPATVAALIALDELGLRVPEDIAVVGTADQQWRPLIPRRVPVVVLDSYKLGAGAAKLLDELISRGQVTDDTEVIVGVDLDEPDRAD